MTTEAIEQEPTAEEVAAETAEAEAAFAAGFAKVEKREPSEPSTKVEETETSPQATEKSAAEQEAEAKAAEEAKAKADAQAAADKEWEGVPPVVRARLEELKGVPGSIEKFAGHLGGFKRQLDSVAATAKSAAVSKGAEAPSDAQLAAAGKDSAKWKQMQTEFPEWAEAMEERLTAIASQVKPVQAQAPEPAPPVDVEAISQVAEERALVRMKHPDWKKTARTTEFADWLKGQTTDVRGLAESQVADDAIALFDRYAAHRQAAVDAAAARVSAEVTRQRREKRLTGALTPQGTPTPTTTGISDEEAFARGFKRAAGK